ncbi:LemA family protein [Candidatus Microgenomates bacterium]|nr:LemA family protein [Candidatus Microgenomates bacterium]
MAKSRFIIRPWMWVAAIAIVIALVLAGYYNNFVGLGQSVKSQWADVESSYQRRFDLIPNLVETVKGVADFEKETYLAVTEARTKWLDAQSINDKVTAGAATQSALARLLVMVENYPDLKAAANFADMQTQLEGTENRINVERNRYNEKVRAYNTAVARFPANIFARLFGFSDYLFFEAVDEADKVPVVNFK